MNDNQTIGDSNKQPSTPSDSQIIALPNEDDLPGEPVGALQTIAILAFLIGLDALLYWISPRTFFLGLILGCLIIGCFLAVFALQSSRRPIKREREMASQKFPDAH